MPECWIFLTPTLAHQREERLRLLDPLLRSAPSPPPREAAVKNEPAHTLGMTHRIGDRYRAALRNPKQRKSLYSDRIDDAFKVTYEGIEQKCLELPMGQAVSARIVPNQPVFGGENMQQMTPDRALPIIVEMIEPIGGFD